MQWRTRLGRLAAVMGLGLVVALATGCNGPQLEERNVALQKQLEQALSQNADLQAQNGTLTEQNVALNGEVDRLRAAAKPGTTPTKAKPKPEFGEGVTTDMVGGALQVTLPDAILFESGKADLKPASKRVLDKIATVLNKDYTGDKIRIEGHTDNQPISKSSKNWDDNWELSCNRAMSVVRYLVSKGVSANRVYAAGYSFYKPVASNDTAAGRAKNRRVVMVVYPQGGGS
jgi:chemotaxis protein MotB